MRNVIVTGGSRGLGLAMVRTLAAAGYSVVAVARSESVELRTLAAEMVESKTGAVHFRAYDLGDIEGIAKFTRDLRKELGPIYGLVNNAGIGTEGLLATMPNGDIERLIRINTTAPIVLTKYVVRQMMADGAGRIVNVSSIIASTGYSALSVYAATKASLVGFTRSLAREVGLAPDEAAMLRQAAPMHDVGKIGIPDYILLKPGKLTHEEFEVMKNHAKLGHELLHGSGSAVLQAGAVIALSHHEKYDGSGYPVGLRGDAIPLLGRIVAVADVFDALTSERPYKKAWDLDKAVAFLREGSGAHFDPACVEAFLAAWSDVLSVRERFADEEVPQL